MGNIEALFSHLENLLKQGGKTGEVAKKEKESGEVSPSTHADNFIKWAKNPKKGSNITEKLDRFFKEKKVSEVNRAPLIRELKRRGYKIDSKKLSSLSRVKLGFKTKFEDFLEFILETENIEPEEESDIYLEFISDSEWRRIEDLCAEEDESSECYEDLYSISDDLHPVKYIIIDDEIVYLAKDEDFGFTDEEIKKIKGMRGNIVAFCDFSGLEIIDFYTEDEYEEAREVAKERYFSFIKRIEELGEMYGDLYEAEEVEESEGLGEYEERIYSIEKAADFLSKAASSVGREGLLLVLDLVDLASSILEDQSIGSTKIASTKVNYYKNLIEDLSNKVYDYFINATNSFSKAADILTNFADLEKTAAKPKNKKYQTEKGSFKEMTCPDAPEKKSKFCGCVRYFMSEKNLSLERAKKMCAYIKRRKYGTREV